MNFLESHYEKTNFSRYFQKHTPRPKIYLGNESKKKWVKRSELKYFVSYTCLITCATNSWYFDSGCSRHMMGNKDILVSCKPLSEGLVTFGDGSIARVKNILHVDGLKANLINKIQICDLKFECEF